MSQFVIMTCLVLGAALVAASWKTGQKHPRGYATVCALLLVFACGAGWFFMDRLAETAPTHHRGQAVERASASVIERGSTEVDRSPYRSIEDKVREAAEKNSSENQAAREKFQALPALQDEG